MKWILLAGLVVNTMGNAQTNFALVTENVTPKEAQGNFIRMDGMIFVDASVNGKKGKFLLDTGAPHLLLNQIPAENARLRGRSISREVEVGTVEVESFALENFLKEDFEGLSLDISHLEKVFKCSIAGLLGFKIMEGRCLYIDFETHTARIISLKERKRLTRFFLPDITIPFYLENHLPVVKAKIGKKRLRLGIDTGAEACILNKELCSKLDLKEQKPERKLVRGIDRSTVRVDSYELNDIHVGDKSLAQLPFLFTDISHFKHPEIGWNIDGLLGMSFFDCSRFVIDYERRKIYLWN